MNEKNETFRNLLGTLFLAALLLFLTLAIVRVKNAASGLEYPPEKELFSLQTLGSVEMLPTQPGEGMPPQAPPENGMPPQFPGQGAPPQFDGSQPPNPSDGNGVVQPPQTAENGEAPQPFAGMPPQFNGQGAPPQQFGGMPQPFDGQGAPPQFPAEPPNFGRSSTAFGPVQVDGKTWAILIVESVILALGIAFASLYKKERP